MARFFISYRRADSAMASGRLHDRLAQAFGDENVFKDVDDIPPGRDFRDVIAEAVDWCDVLFVVIGRQWLNIQDEHGARRLDDPSDFVRLEVEAGLRREHCLVIPVLVDNAPMPPAGELPGSLRELSYLNAVVIRDDPDFHRDALRLITQLEKYFATAKPRRSRMSWVIGATLFALLLIAVLVVIFLLSRNGDDTSPPTATQTATVATSTPTDVPNLETQAALLLTATIEAQHTALAPTASPTPDVTQTLEALVAAIGATENANRTATVEAFTDTPSPTLTPSHTPTTTPTPTETPTSTLTETPTPNLTATASYQAAQTAEVVKETQTAIADEATQNAQLTANAPTNTPKPTNTLTLTPTPTITNTPTYTATSTPTNMPTDTPTPTYTPTVTPDYTLTAEVQANATATANAEATRIFESALATQSAQETYVAQTATATYATQVAYWTAMAPTPTPTDTPSPTPTTTLIPTNASPTATPDPLQAALALAQNFSGSNADWEPFVQDFDGVEMMLVPAGCFMMGSENGDNDEKPVHEVCFNEPFWLDRYEVTNARYKSEGRFSGVDQPRDSVTWHEAQDFCEGRETRLPTEAEWEYAARGPDGLMYPWGNEFSSSHTIYSANSDGHTANIGTALDISWIGAEDMSGNLREWVSDWYAREYDTDVSVVNPSGPTTGIQRVLKGGSWWHGDPDFLRGAARDWYYPDDRSELNGFRCARATTPTPTPPPVESPPTNSTPTPSAVPDPLQTALTHATTFTGSNDDWEPFVKEFDGVEMVLVPAGCFEMGSENGNSNEQPVHKVCFEKPFWIDRTEVTNTQFNEEGYFKGENRPRDSVVSWFVAQSFCEDRGGRLPTEAEWEYAARGPESWVYPWGNEFVGDFVVYEANSNNQTSPVSSNPAGASWVGAMDMSGNIAEWVSTIYQEYPYQPNDGREGNFRSLNSQVIRGGTWFSSELDLRAARRNYANPYDSNYGRGFRCARPADDEF